MRQKIRLGDLLVQQHIITTEQLENTLKNQSQSGRKLGQELIAQGFLSEEQLLQFLSEQLNIPYTDIKRHTFSTELAQQIPETLARRYRVIIIAQEYDSILLGMADPTDIFAYDEIRHLLKRPLKLSVVRESDLLDMLDIIYRNKEAMHSLAGELDEELVNIDNPINVGLEDTNTPVVRFLLTLLTDAVQVRASDIHIEPDETVLRIRMRIDGLLNEQVVNEKRIATALVSRLKLMADLNISEKRLPQDGSFTITIKNQVIDIRLSTMPIQYGESIVLRLLNKSTGLLNLSQLGIANDLNKQDQTLTRFKEIIHRPHGLVLVTGPTGSGKTTTLYAALDELNCAEKKIVSIEDPIEYRLPRINQIQVKEQIGLTFSTILRSTLRQDPDIILIGEMRDEETAEIGLRSAMTGHMVLSSLHTNDAISTASRLIDMGCQPYLVATSLQAIIAQRLLRKICQNCIMPYEPTTLERRWMEQFPPMNDYPLYYGQGCHYCQHTGYQGRFGVYELLEMDQNLAAALHNNNHAQFIQLCQQLPTFTPLSHSAIEYAKEGQTTLQEVIRLSGSINQ